MRSKEGAKDYRFFPEPDLPPLIVEEQVISTIEASLPELPDAMKERLVSSYGLSSYESSVLVNEPGAVAFLELIAQTSSRPAKLVANWILNELFSYLKATNSSIQESPVSAEALGELIDLVVDSTVSGKTAKDVLEIMYYENLQSPVGTTASAIVEKKNWKQIQDEDEIRALCMTVLADPVRVCNRVWTTWTLMERWVFCRKPRRIRSHTAMARPSSSDSSLAKS
jgi:aspartyl-tRNA(Asn)/glutamyl-tRNA(Gln) amidotransferase subunit B